jgi:hypothetical protein
MRHVIEKIAIVIGSLIFLFGLYFFFQVPQQDLSTFQPVEIIFLSAGTCILLMVLGAVISIVGLLVLYFKSRN